MKRTKKHVFAVIRLDCFLNGLEPPTNAVTIKEVVLTEEEAESEVRRLNALNRDKECIYFWQVTRFVENSVTLTHTVNHADP